MSTPLFLSIPQTLGRGGGGHGGGGHGGGGHGGGGHGGWHGGGWHGGGGRWGGRGGWGGRGWRGRGWGWGWPGYAQGWGGWGWGWDWPWLYATGPALDTCAYNAPQAAVYLEENYGGSPWWRGVKVETMTDGSQVLHVAVADRAAGNLLPTSICSYPVVASVAAPMAPGGVSGLSGPGEMVEFGPARGTAMVHSRGLMHGARYGLVLASDKAKTRRQIERELEAHGFHPEEVSAGPLDSREDWNWSSGDRRRGRLYAVARWEGPDHTNLLDTDLPAFAHVFSYDMDHVATLGDVQLSPQNLCERDGGTWDASTETCSMSLGDKEARRAACEASGGVWGGYGCIKTNLPDPDVVGGMEATIKACQEDLASHPECEKWKAICLDPKAKDDPMAAEVCVGALAAEPPKKSIMPWIVAGGIGVVAVGLLVATVNMKPSRPATA